MTQGHRFTLVLVTALAAFSHAPLMLAEEVTDSFSELPAQVLDSGVPSPEKMLFEIDAAISGGSGANSAACVLESASHFWDQGYAHECPLPPMTSCGAFMDTTCAPGTKGQFIQKLFKTTTPNNAGQDMPLNHYFEAANTPSDTALYCKNYKSFDAATKEQFWTYFLMNLAYFETQCDLKAFQKHLPGGSGAYQMEKSNASRRQIRPQVCWDENLRKLYGKNAQITETKPNFHCAMAILALQLAKPGSSLAEPNDLRTFSKGQLFSGGSYFGQLRITKMFTTNDAGEKVPTLLNRLRQFKACGN